MPRKTAAAGRGRSEVGRASMRPRPDAAENACLRFIALTMLRSLQ